MSTATPPLPPSTQTERTVSYDQRVSKRWGDISLAAYRQRFLDALAGLARRPGAQ